MPCRGGESASGAGYRLFDFDPRSGVSQAQAAYAKERTMATDLFASRRKMLDAPADASAEAAAATA